MKRAALLVALAACRQAEPPPTVLATRDAGAPPPIVTVATPEPPPPPPPAAPADAGAPTCDRSRVPKFLARMPCFEPTDSMLIDRDAGFSKDGRYLGMCISTCDPCPPQCELDDSVTRGKRTVRWASSLDDPELGKVPDEVIEKRLEKKNAANEAFLAAVALPKITNAPSMRGTWPYPDIAFAARSEDDAKHGATIASFGASVDDDEPVYPFRIVFGPQKAWREALAHVPPKATAKQREDAIEQWHATFALFGGLVAAVDVSPDGKDLGVVGFARGPMWYEETRSARMPVTAFAEKVYQAAADAASRRGDKDRAAALLARAGAVAKKP